MYILCEDCMCPMYSSILTILFIIKYYPIHLLRRYIYMYKYYPVRSKILHLCIIRICMTMCLTMIMKLGYDPDHARIA